MKKAAVIATVVAYAIYAWSIAATGLGTTPDSDFYLSFSPLYPTGYSAFLAVFGTRGAAVLQPLLFALALGWLGLEVLWASSRLTVALAVVAAALAVPGLTAFHASVLTESLFMSCEVAILAAALRFLSRPTWQVVAVAATIGGLAAMIRNAGLVYLPALFVLVSLQRRPLRDQSMAVAAVVLPMLLLVGAERLIAHLVNGDAATSLLGRHLFAKAALIDAPPPRAALDEEHRVIEEALDRSFGPIRQAIAEAPSSLRSILTVYYELCLQGPCARDMRERSIAARPEAEQNGILVRTALSRIARAPFAFARLTARHYGSLWVAFRQEHPDMVPLLNDYFATHRLPYQDRAFSWRDPSQPLHFEVRPTARVIQPAVIAIAFVTGVMAVGAVALAVVRISPPPLVGLALLAAFIAHAGVLFSATFAAGLSRFTISFWPAVMVSLVLGGWLVIERLGKPLRGRGA